MKKIGKHLVKFKAEHPMDGKIQETELSFDNLWQARSFIEHCLVVKGLKELTFHAGPEGNDDE